MAHREEILNQSRDTFRRIRPEARLGLYMGQERQADADVLFASIQTLGRAAHLERFPRDACSSPTSARSSCSASPPPRSAPTAATSSPSARRTSSTAATSSRA